MYLSVATRMDCDREQVPRKQGLKPDNSLFMLQNEMEDREQVPRKQGLKPPKLRNAIAAIQRDREQVPRKQGLKRIYPHLLTSHLGDREQVPRKQGLKLQNGSEIGRSDIRIESKFHENKD